GLRKWLILLFDFVSFVFSIMLFFNPCIATFALPKLVGFSAIAFGIMLIIRGSVLGSHLSE
ncbi:MAG TPA: hypothetical protein IAA20_00455, partial [Candidatus Enterococcus avicola]|nr:hypothetical protein [Candidatus Enterococcus avicola]